MTHRPYLVRLERTLRDIESRVLEEVWIGHVKRTIGVALTLMLGGAAALWWLGSDASHAGRVVTGAAAMFVRHLSRPGQLSRGAATAGAALQRTAAGCPRSSGRAHSGGCGPAQPTPDCGGW